MILLRCHILGFGKFTNTTISFRDGLNVIHACNEGGKSTLQRCLVSLLYGQLRPEMKARRHIDQWVEQYRPWSGSPYGGVLWCRLADGREVEVQRYFGKDEIRLMIRSAAGEDLTRNYEQQRNGEVLFAQTHLELPKELFESAAVIRESRLTELTSPDTMRERIANLAQSGDEELSVRQSLSRLEEALASIGTDRAPTRPYRMALGRGDALREEARALQARRLEYHEWLQERVRLDAEVLQLEKAYAAAQHSMAVARRRETATRVRILLEMDAQLRCIRREMESCAGNPDFPAGNLETLDQLVGECRTAGKTLDELQSKIQSVAGRLQKIEAERTELAPYALLSGSLDADKITEWFSNYLRSSIQRDNILRSVAQLERESAECENALGRFAPLVRDSSVDWHRKTAEAVERERSNAERSLALTARCSEVKASVMRIKSLCLVRRILAVALLLLAAALQVAPLLRITSPLPQPISVVMGVGFAAGAVLFWILADRSNATAGILAEAVGEIEGEQVRLKEESETLFAEIHAVMTETGLKTIDEFLAEVEQAGSGRQRILMLKERLDEAMQQRDQVAAECDSVYQKLEESLMLVGCGCSRASLKSQVDILRAGLRQLKDVEMRHQACSQELESLRSQEESLRHDMHERRERLEAILSEAGVASPDDFRRECQARQRHLELLEKGASHEREYNRHCENLTLAQWQEALQDFENQEKVTAAKLGGSAVPPPGQQGPDSMSPLLPYPLSTVEAQNELQSIAARLAAARENQVRLVERVRQAFHNYRTVSEIEEDLALVTREQQELETNRKALEIALGTLSTIVREQQEALAPQLNSAVEQRFLRLSQGRYREVKVDSDLAILVRENENAELRPSCFLSRGTQDQLYFAFRFAILDFLSNACERCPCLLDEPFAAYDSARLETAFQVLEEESRRRQVILFTCRADVRDAAAKYGAKITVLENRNNLDQCDPNPNG